MTLLFIGAIAIIIFILQICAFSFAYAEYKEKKKIEKELNEVKKHDQETADIITEANKIKADARSGDVSRDINFIADKLHDYATK